MFLNGWTGTGIRVAVIDSGVHAAHPHVGGVAGAFGILDDGTLTDDYLDHLGHGTAVTAAIREKVPAAEIVAIKVFWRSLATDVATLIRAIEEGSMRGAHVINLSLGTADRRHRDRLAAAVAAARDRGSIVVSATDDRGIEWLPGMLPDAIGVRADWSGDRHGYAIAELGGRDVIAASPYPREIPGVPRDRNVHGVSFAVANASAFVARALEAAPTTDIDAVFTTLRDAACAVPIA